MVEELKRKFRRDELIALPFGLFVAAVIIYLAVRVTSLEAYQRRMLESVNSRTLINRVIANRLGVSDAEIEAIVGPGAFTILKPDAVLSP